MAVRICESVLWLSTFSLTIIGNHHFGLMGAHLPRSLIFFEAGNSIGALLLEPRSTLLNEELLDILSLFSLILWTSPYEMSVIPNNIRTYPSLTKRLP